MNTGNKPHSATGAVIVAAGMSSRMKSFKPMLPLAASTVIRTLIGTLQQAGVAPIIVVTGRNSAELTRHIADLAVITIENIHYAKTDMFFSAGLGLNAVADQAERVFFLPGDVPLFSRHSLAAMSEYMDQNPCDILIPTYNGRQGHPVLIKTRAIAELTAFSGQGGLRAAIKNYDGKKCRIALPDQGLILDADNPADYFRLTEYLAADARQMPLTCGVNLTLSKSEVFFDAALASLLELTQKHGSLTKA
ncbi:MAG: nucleotidyltransferase family protein, partial [Clostridia bacterium]|nr:nucleotidyltransferase family protein [Clostridia bacterium]